MRRPTSILAALSAALLLGCSGPGRTVVPSVTEMPKANSLALIRPRAQGPPIIFCGADPATALRRCAPFSEISSVIPSVLPPHMPGPACKRGWILTFGFEDGATVTYRQCSLPPSIAAVEKAALHYLKQNASGSGVVPG